MAPGITYILIRMIGPEDTYFFEMDKDEIRNRLAALLKTDLDDLTEYKSIVDRLLRFHGPFGLKSTFTVSLNEEMKSLQTETKTGLLIDSPGTDAESIYLNQIRGFTFPIEKKSAIRKYPKAGVS